jgi:vesicular inhibitory amino acid transporter
VNPLAKFALTLDPVAKGAEEKLKLRVKESSKDAFISRLVRTTLGVTALGIAVKLPFFGVGMSLIGSVLTLTVSVLFPSLCYLRMFDDDIDDAEKLINYAILAIGTACVVSGTAGALDSAFAVAA